MVLSDFSERDSWMHRLDPRGRLAVCFAFSIFLARCSDLASLGCAFVVSAFLLASAKISFSEIRGRFLALNFFVLLLFLTMPFSGKGEPLFQLGFLSCDRAAFWSCCEIALRSNAIMFLVTALINTMDIVTLGHALSLLRFPPKLVHLLLFTVRQIEIIHFEYLQIKRAMKVRGFKPGMNLRTYKSFAQLVAVLLLRSVDRSECVLAAMKCRCFNGHFYVLRDFMFVGRDILFVIVSFGILTLLILGEFN